MFPLLDQHLRKSGQGPCCFAAKLNGRSQCFLRLLQLLIIETQSRKIEPALVQSRFKFGGLPVALLCQRISIHAFAGNAQTKKRLPEIVLQPDRRLK